MQKSATPTTDKPSPPAAGKFGLDRNGVELPAYHPTGCPSLEQFEARYLFASDTSGPLSAA